MTLKTTINCGDPLPNVFTTITVGHKCPVRKAAAVDACDIDEIEEVPTTSHRLSRHDKAIQRFRLIGSLSKPESEHNTTRV